MTSDRIIPLSEYHRLPQSAQDANFYKRQLEVICNNATLALFIMDEYQRCVYMNPAAEALTGYSLAETQGRALHDVIHHTRPDGSPYPLCECPIDQVFPQNNQEQGEEVFVHKDGHFYPVAYTASPIRERDRTIGTIIEVRDITQEKRDEQMRQDARIALASINDGFYTLDRNWCFTYVNDRYCEMTGMSPSELLGQNIWELFPAAVDTEAYVQFHQVMADQAPQQFDYLYAPWNCWHNHRIYPSPNGLTVLIADITDRKQTEEALQRSEERFRVALQNTPIVVFNQDRDLRYTWIHNPKLGYSVAEVLGKTDYDLNDPDTAAALTELKQQVLASGIGSRQEVRAADSTGETGYYDLTLEPMRDESGQVVGITAAVFDITELKRTEAALRESELRFRRLVESSLFGVAFGDFSGGIHYANDYFLDLIGYSREEIKTGQVQWTEITPAEFLPLDESAMLELRSQGVAMPFEKEFIRKDGSTVPILIGSALLQEPYDQQQEIVAFFLNLTERKQAEAQIQRSQAIAERQLMEIEAIYYTAPIGLAILDTDLRFLRINQRLAEINGISVEDHIGRTVREVVPELADQVEPLFRRVLATGEPLLNLEISGETNAQPGIRRTWIENWYPLKDGSGQVIGINAVVQEITDRKQAEVERERLLQQEQAAREAAENANRIKDEFLAVLSHELRSPLNPILGWSKLLQQGNLDEARIKTALATIERNAQLQAQLIDDLLDISRILRGKLSLDVRSVDLNAVISAALDTVHLAAEAKSLHIQTTFSSQARAVMGDAGRLQQVIWNLLSNAVKFTPPNGQIFVTLTQAGTHAQIQVRDTGKGIKPDFLPFVFEHFRQEDGATTRKFGGLGLGLAIVRQIVEMHGGRISVESPGEGQGTTFTVQIPFAPQSIRLPAAAAPSNSTSRGLQGLRVWVVDDESDSREFVAFVLEQAGAIVTRFASGIEALQAMRQTVPDVIVSDIGMPEMDGYMLMQQIRSLDSIEQCKTVPAIALTAYAGEFDRQRALQAGFQRHVAKPVDPTELTAIVARSAAAPYSASGCE